MNNPTTETNEQFFARLQSFDWYYEMSDDSRQYRAGKTAFMNLRSEAKESAIKQRMFDAYRTYIDGTITGDASAVQPELSDFSD